MSSDLYGYIIQYDMYKQDILDKKLLPDEKEGKVMLTHFLDGRIGASAREGASVIELYKLDDKKVYT